MPSLATPDDTSAFGAANLVAELSARFVGLSSEAIDAEIVRAQRELCQTLGFDRITLFQLQADGGSMVSTHTWPLDPPEPTIKSSDLPFLSAKLFRGEMIRFASHGDFPPEGFADRDWIRGMAGPLSNVTFPLLAGGRVFGALAFSTLYRERTWSDALVAQLQLISAVFANTMARGRLWTELESQSEQMTLAVEAAQLGLWAWDSTGNMWATERTRELLGFTAAESIHYDDFLQRLHPDDRGRVREAMTHAFAMRAAYSTEYRVLQADGTFRWLASRGKFCKDRSGRGHEVVGVLQDITDRKHDVERLAKALAEVETLRERLQNENVYLQEEVKLAHGQIIGRSLAIRQVLRQVEQVASGPSTVLIQGETGTGKELVAAAIHDASPRRGHPMIKVNCAAVPAALMESEFFGREKGAYTGALARQLGRFELAHGSTIFLDEVGEIPLELQAKLLRVLQDRQIERLGSPRPIAVDVRIVAATNRDLHQEVKAGRFREDLFYRLNVFPIAVPPLRERVEDIPLLVNAFLKEFAAAQGKQVTGITRSSLDALLRYDWPGNVRELRNVVERAVIVATGPRVSLAVPAASVGAPSRSMSMRDVEKDHILQVLKSRGWRVRGAAGAAVVLGLKPSTLESRMKKLGITRTPV